MHEGNSLFAVSVITGVQRGNSCCGFHDPQLLDQCLVRLLTSRCGLSCTSSSNFCLGFLRSMPPKTIDFSFSILAPYAKEILVLL